MKRPGFIENILCVQSEGLEQRHVASAEELKVEDGWTDCSLGPFSNVKDLFDRANTASLFSLFNHLLEKVGAVIFVHIQKYWNPTWLPFWARVSIRLVAWRKKHLPTEMFTMEDQSWLHLITLSAGFEFYYVPIFIISLLCDVRVWLCW